MPFLLRRCPICFLYTFSDKCPRCGEKTVNPHPPRFSPVDRYGHYRRMAKKKILNGENPMQPEKNT